MIPDIRVKRVKRIFNLHGFDKGFSFLRAMQPVKKGRVLIPIFKPLEMVFLGNESMSFGKEIVESRSLVYLSIK